MFKRIPNSPLGRRLVISLVTIVFLVSSLSSAFIIWSSYHEGLKRYDNILSQVTQGYQESITHSLWTYDLQQLKALSQGITNFPSIVYVQIDGTDDVLIQHGDMYEKFNRKVIIPLVFTQSGEKHRLGTLRVNQSHQELFDDLMDRAKETIFSQLILATIISLIMLYVLHRLVTSRLLTMAKWAKSFKLNRLDVELPVNFLYSDDELGHVASAINQMRLTIRKELALKEQEHEAHSRLQGQFELAVNNAELGFCRYYPASKTMECNPHFAKHIGLTEDQVETLSQPMKYILEHIFGEQADNQVEQIQGLLLGRKKFLHDRYILNSPNHFSVLDISFQVASFSDNLPDTILMCTTNRTNEFNLQALIQRHEQEQEQHLAELEASYSRKLRAAIDEKNSLKRESRRLGIAQQPKHVQLLTQLMAKELQHCQQVISEPRFLLLQKFLALNFYNELKPFDLSIAFSELAHDLIQQHNPKIQLSEDLPLTLMVEEDYEVFRFLNQMVLCSTVLKQATYIKLKVRLVYNEIKVSWQVTGQFAELSESQLLALEIASMVVQMRYNGVFSHQKSGDQLTLLISAPFKT